MPRAGLLRAASPFRLRKSATEESEHGRSRDLEQARSMPRQLSGEGPIGRFDFSMVPEIPHFGRAEEAQVLPVNRHARGKGIEIEDRDVVAALPEIGDPHGCESPRYLFCRVSGLIDGEDFIVEEQLFAVVGQLRQVSAERKRSIGHRPQGHRGLLFRICNPVRGSIADLKRVEIVPAQRGTRSALPSDQIVKAKQHALPFGQIRAVSFALDVAFNAACIRVLLPVAKVVLIERPGQRKPDGTAAQRNGFGHGLNIGDVVDVEIVAIRAGGYRVELDEIDAPRCIKVDD